MITHRRSAERGRGSFGWLETYYTFSFASYFDADHLGFRTLRVLNDDTIAPARGFGPHAHRDMEIITYILSGELRHKDSMGEERIFGRNVVQCMSAGTGVVHSEANPSTTEPVHLIQIWIEPSGQDFKPNYQQFPFSENEKLGRLRLIAAPQRHPDETAAVINQDAFIHAGVIRPRETVTYLLREKRHAWVHLATGTMNVNGHPLSAGDAVAMSDEPEIVLSGSGSGGEVLVFDLP